MASMLQSKQGQNAEEQQQIKITQSFSGTLDTIFWDCFTLDNYWYSAFDRQPNPGLSYFFPIHKISTL